MINARFIRLARAIAASTPIDWPHEISAAPTETQRRLIASLRTIHEASGASAHSTPPDSDTREQAWGSFVLHDIVGRGAYGIVYRATDSRLDREVALKLLEQVELTIPPKVIDEGRLLSRVRHPNVVSVYGAEVHDGRTGIWMEFIRGRSYHDIVASEGPLSAAEASLVGITLCQALTAVHAAGLIHRDVTARNVMREFGGRVVLLDFSASRVAADDDEAVRIAGTPLYMAPEVLLAGASPSLASDIYSVGVLLFYLATGTFPVVAGSLAELRAAQRCPSRRIGEVRPALPGSFTRVVQRALDPVPQNRFISADDMAQALSGVEPLSVQPLGKLPDLKPRGVVRKRLSLWAAAALVIIIGAAWWRQEAQSAETSAPSLSGDQWAVLDGYLEMADSAGERGAWVQAVEAYKQAAKILSIAVGDDEPMRAVVLAREGWALAQAGQFRDAHTQFDLALYKLAQEVGDDHPMRATIELARAEAFWKEHEGAKAAAAVDRASGIHRRSMQAVGLNIRSMPSVRADQIPADGPCSDQNQNWLLDMFETTIHQSTTVISGFADEQDTDGDGISDGLAWPYECDPRRSVVHFGAVNPLRAGFRQERALDGNAGTGEDPPHWRIESPMGFYYARLTNAMKTAAISKGWRLRGQFALVRGNAFVDLDLTPLAGRFDLGLFATPQNRASFILMTNSMPRQGEAIDLGELGARPFVEFIADPGNATARLLVNGKTIRTVYGGYQQYQEDFGLFFGVTNDLGRTAKGLGEFSLASLSVR